MARLAFRLVTGLNFRLQLIFFATLVGICGGGAAVLLNLGLHKASVLLAPFRADWYACLLPATGIILAIIVFRYLFRDQGAHGVPEVIYAISNRGGLLRLRMSASRLVACLLTLAGGGSAGPEAPVVISGASIGSNIASRFKLRDRQRIVLVGCGASAAIASIFNAPATGIVFTLEAVLGEWTQVNIIPIAIASVVGTEVSRLLQGNQIPFTHRFFNVSFIDLLACIGLSLITALSSVLFVRILRLIEKQMSTRLNSIWLRAIGGGMLIGAIGILFPDVLGEGYSSIQAILNNSFHPSLWMIAALILAKMVATSLTIGAGGVGGVFAPSLLIGSMTGLLYHDTLSRFFPQFVPAEPGYYGLLGMAGVVSAVLQAPLTGIFLIMEITGGYDVLVSVVLVSVLSATLGAFFEPDSLYHRNLKRKGQLLRSRSDARVLSEIHLVELLDTDCISVRPDMTLGELVRVIGQSRRNYFPVENPDNGLFVGLVTLDNVRSFLGETHFYNSMLVEEFIDDSIPIVGPEDALKTTLQVMEEKHAFSLPVVERGHFLGLISKATLLDHYRKEIVAQEED